MQGNFTPQTAAAPAAPPQATGMPPMAAQPMPGWVATPTQTAMPSHSLPSHAASNNYPGYQQGYYPTQGSAAMQPQATVPMGTAQVIPFPGNYQGVPVQAVPQPSPQAYPQQPSLPDYYSNYNNPAQYPQGYQTQGYQGQPQQGYPQTPTTEPQIPASMLDKVVSLLSTPIRFPFQGQSSDSQGQPGQYQQGYPQYPATPTQTPMAGTTAYPAMPSPQTSPQIPASLPNFSPQLPPHLVQLILSDPNAAISATQIADEQIPYSKRELNAVAVAYENAVQQLAAMAEKGQQAIVDATHMYDLLTNPQELNNLLPILLVHLNETPGGWDLLSQHVDALTQVKAQMGLLPQNQQYQQGYPQDYLQAGMSMQGQTPSFETAAIGAPMPGQVPFQQPMSSAPQYVQTGYPQGQGQMPGAGRPEFPPMPMPGYSGSNQVGLGDVPPDQQWMVADQLDRSGYFRQKVLFQP